ncbi:hypothetical protein [Actinoplanes sp. NPDC023714]|uniref:hypothetical protein n=1 Tax=Actinoplanes sp. NPDC023714 TaxID=3154322 RepID=UPI0033D6DDC8
MADPPERAAGGADPSDRPAVHRALAGPGPRQRAAVVLRCPVGPGVRPPGAIAAGEPLPPDLVEWASASVTCFLHAEIPRLLPEARFAAVPGAQAGPLTAVSPGGEPPWGNRVDAMTLIRDDAGTGDLTVMVGVVDPSVAEREEQSCRRDTAARCTVRRGPDGEIVLLSTERDPLPAGNPRNWVVRVYRGHSEINVQVSNTDRQGPSATRPEPVLTAEQAVELALSPSLQLFP